MARCGNQRGGGGGSGEPATRIRSQLRQPGRARAPAPHPQGQVATGARMLWQDTVDLMGAVGRMGLPHTTLQSKCAYYE